MPVRIVVHGHRARVPARRAGRTEPRRGRAASWLGWRVPPSQRRRGSADWRRRRRAAPRCLSRRSRERPSGRLPRRARGASRRRPRMSTRWCTRDDHRRRPARGRSTGGTRARPSPRRTPARPRAAPTTRPIVEGFRCRPCPYCDASGTRPSPRREQRHRRGSPRSPRPSTHARRRGQRRRHPAPRLRRSPVQGVAAPGAAGDHGVRHRIVLSCSATASAVSSPHAPRSPSTSGWVATTRSRQRRGRGGN